MTDQVEDTGAPSNEPELTPIQQEAIEQGWVPKEEFKGDPEKWVDAAEYVRRGELFRKIELQSRELKDVKNALRELKKLHSSVADIEYQRALETLKAHKKEALENGDADAVIAADERIDLIREQQRLAQIEAAQAEAVNSGDQHPVFVEWVSRNSWYQSNAPMRAFADALGADLARQGMTPEQVLKEVEKEVRKEFPQRFQNQRQNRPSAVESGSKSTSSSKSSFTLTPEERRIMNTLVRQGALTEEQYIADLKKIKGV